MTNTIIRRMSQPITSNSSNIEISNQPLSYSGMLKPTEEICIKDKKDNFIMPLLRFKPIRKKKRAIGWLHAENCDKQNVYLLEELFELMLEEFSTLGYYLRSDKVRAFTDFASWCYENSSDFEMYKQ